MSHTCAFLLIVLPIMFTRKRMRSLLIGHDPFRVFDNRLRIQFDKAGRDSEWQVDRSALIQAYRGLEYIGKIVRRQLRYQTRITGLHKHFLKQRV